MKKQLQFIITTIFMISVGLAGYVQWVNDVFIASNIMYRIKKLVPNKELEVKGSINTGDLAIHYQSYNFEVIIIEINTFRNNRLTNVDTLNNVNDLVLNQYKTPTD